MKPATLTVEPAPEVGPDVTLLTVDCPHGTTSGHFLMGAQSPVSAAAIARVVIAKHYSVERCRCTLPLRRRYGVRA